MSEQEKKEPILEKRSSRRTFIKNSGLTVGGVVIGGALGSLLTKDSTTKTTETHVHSAATAVNFNQALMYFDKAQFDTIDAATEQIFPKTETGPGAKELLVAYYIDHQLAGNWGLNTKEYMHAPFNPTASPLFGHQTHLNRQQIFDLGIEALNTEAMKKHKAKFNEITEEEQVAILKACEEGEVTLNGAVTSTYFFNLLKSATIEGAYADPLYGGNKDMQGWKMKNFPGHQMSYANIIDKDEFVKIEPTSLNSQHKH
ncbi:gluconate 2-dehydrogenase subunit 3 family protein [Bacillus sp. FJAT-22090]|uniref:gluconate 2-dehydrogenase subunit 3 family protein n=1 Tax=Bacillus sp. FJAT-22090 TaxID=1581038 RepID=UPI0011A51B66|nr:gluconate 2-dehydrogenase subunit 3 family protein [Bacillus sp. FJAT-22090]